MRYGVNVSICILSAFTLLYSEDGKPPSLQSWASAVQAGDISKVKEYLPKIDVNTRITEHGFTALHIAAVYGHVEVTKLLLDQTDIAVNARIDIGDTPLHLAAYKGHHEVTQELLKHKHIDVNAKGDDEDTPLHLAAYKGHHEIVRALLAHGADPFQENITHATPLVIARQAEHTTTTIILSLYMLYYELTHLTCTASARRGFRDVNQRQTSAIRSLSSERCVCI